MVVGRFVVRPVREYDTEKSSYRVPEATTRGRDRRRHRLGDFCRKTCRLSFQANNKVGYALESNGRSLVQVDNRSTRDSGTSDWTPSLEGPRS